MRERSWDAGRESLPNIRNTYVYCEHIIQTFGTATNAQLLALRVAWIIAKHKEYIGLLWTCYQHIKKNNKCVIARGARGVNHSKQKEYISVAWQCYSNMKKTINVWTLAGRGAKIIAKHKEYIGLL